MARKKQPTADRIIEDFLSLPPAEGKLLLSFLTTTTRLATIGGAGFKARPTAAPNMVVTQQDVPTPLKTRRPRIARPTAAVPAGEAGPETMTVGEDQ